MSFSSQFFFYEPEIKHFKNVLINSFAAVFKFVVRWKQSFLMRKSEVEYTASRKTEILCQELPAGLWGGLVQWRGQAARSKVAH